MCVTDLADVIESIRRVKRRLCIGPLKESPDRVFQGDFLDIAALESLKETLLSSASEPTERQECVLELQHIIDALRHGPPRPSDRELCERFVSGRIDLRTVVQITTWSPVELYDTCASFNLNVPDIRS
jgi:hypothetical protein